LLGLFQEKGVGGRETELENGGTTNTILSFFMVQSIWIFQETPPPTHLILIDFSSNPDALFPGTALRSVGTYVMLISAYHSGSFSYS